MNALCAEATKDTNVETFGKTEAVSVTNNVSNIFQNMKFVLTSASRNKKRKSRFGII